MYIMLYATTMMSKLFDCIVTKMLIHYLCYLLNPPKSQPSLAVGMKGNNFYKYTIFFHIKN